MKNYFLVTEERAKELVSWWNQDTKKTRWTAPTEAIVDYDPQKITGAKFIRLKTGICVEVNTNGYFCFSEEELLEKIKSGPYTSIYGPHEIIEPDPDKSGW